MNQRSSLFAVVLAVGVLGCSVGSRAPGRVREAPLQPSAQRVVLLSLDGLGAARHRDMIDRGAYRDPEGLASLERSGFVVERAVPVNPTLTAVNHVTIATGAAPGRHGIVSNWFHRPGTPITSSVSGFDTPIAAETLWQAFRRQGKRVGVLTFPGCDGTNPERTADFGMLYVSASFARSRVETLRESAFETDPSPVGSAGFAPLRRARLAVALRGDGLPAELAFSLTALDTVDDGITAYDTLVVDDDRDAANGTLATVHTGEWFPLSFTAPHADGGRRLIGGWCRLQAFPANLAGVRIYRGAFHATEAYPRSFRERLDADVGFWPGAPDENALERGLGGRQGLSLPEFVAQAHRFSDYFNACARVAVASQPFDLLMAYQPTVDETQHSLLIVDPRQTPYTSGLAATAAAAVDDAYRLADHAVGELSRALDPASDALVVVSDHGMTSIWETVYLNEVLHRAGLLEVEEGERGPRPAATSRVVAVTSGGIAHLYVNLAGREVGGVVAAEELAATVRAAAQALALVEVDGEAVVEEAVSRPGLAALGLDSPSSGDLVVFMRPGFYPSGRLGRGVHEPSTFFGQHGYLASHPDLAAVWFARGAAVRRGRLAEASLTEVAGYVARLAGVDPPSQARPWQH